MKLQSKHLEKDGSGSISLIAEEGEDLWHVYNLLSKDDLLKATTIRRVVTEGSTGSTEKTSHKITLTIQVDTLFYDVQANALRVNGRNAVENKWVKMGGYHTLDLELHRPFTITKECWDVIHLERIQDCCDVAKRAEIAAVVLQEGLAQICLVTENMTIVRQRIESNVPKKRRGTTTDHDKGMIRFMDQIYQGICQHINFEMIKILIIASPGFYKDNLLKYIVEEALRNQFKPLLDNRYCSNLLIIHWDLKIKNIYSQSLFWT
jgi:protein pelota